MKSVKIPKPEPNLGQITLHTALKRLTEDLKKKSATKHTFTHLHCSLIKTFLKKYFISSLFLINFYMM